MSWRNIIIVGIVIVGAYFLFSDDISLTTKDPISIVTFGDSLTAGFGVNKEDSYPAYLEKRLRELGATNVTIRNEGISGDTTQDGVTRLPTLALQKGDIVILTLGANDMLRRYPPQQTETNLRTIIESLKKQDVTVVLAGMKTPIGFGGTFGEQFDAIFPKLAQEYKLAFIPYFLKGVALRPDLNIQDNIHPNKEGYIKIVDENILPVLLPVLSK